MTDMRILYKRSSPEHWELMRRVVTGNVKDAQKCVRVFADDPELLRRAQADLEVWTHKLAEMDAAEAESI